MAITLLAARRALLQAIPELGATYTPTAAASGSITIGSLANSNFPTNHFRNRIAYRGEAATAADYERYLSTLTAATGLITITGSYADTTITSESVEIWMDPEIRVSTHINPLLADAVSQLRVLCHVPLGHGPLDYDMQASGITNWPDGSTGTTPAKQTTTTEVAAGARSLVVTDSGSGGGYTQSALYPLRANGDVNVFAIVKAATGTAKLTVLDENGSTQAILSTTEEDWVLLWKRVTMAGAEKIRLRPSSVAASDSGVWQAAWFARADDFHYAISRVPGWITAPHHVVGLSIGWPQVSAGTDAYHYGSMLFERLTEGVDYYCQRPSADANPTAIFLLKPGLAQYPLFIDVSSPASEPYGVTAAFTAETDTTFLSKELLLAQAKILLGERFPRYADQAQRGIKEKTQLLAQEMYPTKEPRPTGWRKRPFG